VLIASMYPCPFDHGSLHDYNFALIRFNGREARTLRSISLPTDDVYAYEEGKCNTEKHSGSSHFPRRSFAMGFAELVVSPESVDAWVFPTPSPAYDLANIFYMLHYVKAIDSVPSLSEQQDLVAAGFVRFVPHQEAHAGLAAFTSPFEEGFFFTLDGGGDPGDPRDSVFGVFSGGQGLETVWESTPSPLNVSKFHDRLTEYFGFREQDNGKVSGLAAYGRVDQRILDYFESSLIWANDRPLVKVPRIRRTPTRFREVSLDKFDIDRHINPNPGYLQMVQDLAEFSPVDVAASGEHFFRELVKANLHQLLDKHDVPRNGCFSGGVFNNVRLNQDLAKHDEFRAHFSMAPGDAGLALGAALVSSSNYQDFRVKSAFLGPSFSRSRTEELFQEFGLPCQETSLEDVAGLIADGRIVGWFAGRGEYGPRSLGARSILGDPRSPIIKARLNQLAKRRDFFMPFAPAVLSEHVESLVSEAHSNPYMQVAVDVSESARLRIPAAVHVDGTARVQVVECDKNPTFYALISAFYKVTGVPAVLNTSFNRHGISTISTPRAALEHLLQGCVEYLYLDGFLVSRSDYVAEISGSERVRGEDELLAEFATSLGSKHNDLGIDRDSE